MNHNKFVVPIILHHHNSMPDTNHTGGWQLINHTLYSRVEAGPPSTRACYSEQFKCYVTMVS